MVLVFATADVSGGHLNPAVTIAMAITGNLTDKPGEAPVKCAVYILCQCSGAIFGALFLKALTPSSPPAGGTTTMSTGS